MKNLFPFLLFVFLLSQNVFSQSFSGGIVFGVSGNQIDGDEQFKYKKPGLILGAYVLKPISKKSALKIETYYIGKGAVLNIEYTDGSTFQEFKTSLHYIEIPVLYDLQLHPKISVAVGIAPSYLFAHKLVRQKQVLDKNTYSIKNFDVQPMGQVDFFLTDKITSSIQISYSAINIRNEDLTIWRNNNLSVALRYTFE